MRLFLCLLIFLLGLVSGPLLGASNRPNVVLIVADDQGFGDSQTFWSESQVETPNLERLAERGFKFTNYRTQPLCTPSRAAVLTGLFNSGFNQQGSAHLVGVDDRVTFLSEFLRRMGYQTGAFGKWHLGSNDGYHPLDRGFGKWVGFYGGGMPYHYAYGKDQVFDGKLPFRSRWRHSTDLFADQAISFIRANKDAPFFAYLAFNAVHTPIWSEANPVYSARDDWVGKMRARGITEPAAADYYALLEHMDQRVGDVLDVIDDLDLSRNTLIIYLSDNGALTPEHFPHAPQQGSNGPYRGGKASPYEGGIRVPFLVSWPGTIAAGEVSGEAVLDADVMPTILEAAGIIRMPEFNGPRTLNGRSLLSLMKSPDRVKLPERGTPSWLGACFAYVRYPWKLLSVTVKVGGPNATGMNPTNGRLLFNLEDDPGELQDLSGMFPDVAQRMWEEYQDLYYSTRKPIHPDHDVPRRQE